MKPKYRFLNPEIFRGKTLREIGIKSLIDYGDNPLRYLTKNKT